MSVALHQHCVGILTVSLGEKGGEGPCVMLCMRTVFADDCLQSECSVMAGCSVLCFLCATMCGCDCVVGAFRMLVMDKGSDCGAYGGI